MRVLVLGSGVIGASTAWYLAQAGAQVIVVDRQPAVAMETSFANAGQISPGYSTPWAAPGMPLKAIKWLFEKHAPFAFRPDGSWFQLQWLGRMLAQCTADRYAVNKTRMLRLADYSRRCLDTLRAEIGLDYEGRQKGTTQVFRDAAQFEAIGNDTRVLDELGIAWELLDPAGIARVEPGLDVVGAGLAGALRLPGDQTGDCHLFTRALSARARAIGVDFRFGHRIRGLIHEGGRIRGAVVDGGFGPQRLESDAVVVALGSYSRDWLRPVGVHVPVYPVKGYSLTLPITNRDRAPVSTVMDESHKIAVTRFDDRVRVGGMAELAGFDLRLDARRRATLAFVVGNLYPGAADEASASFWTGLRPMTPDGTPIVGDSGVPGLWLNTGHGTLGWTMACGSGRLLSDLIAGRAPEIRADDLGLQRYHGGRRLRTGFKPGHQAGSSSAGGLATPTA
jgi:D-amino-acid dehydrogenase